MIDGKLNLLNLDRKGMETLAVELGYKPFQGRNLFKWIHKHGADSFEGMTDLAKKLRQRLEQTAVIRPPEIIFEQPSFDGTVKWIMQLEDGQRIETVYIPEDNRGTLCVSSQVGCALDCSFCSTAKQGFNRNLSTAEIIGQVWQAAAELGDEHQLTNVVMMGMGEPLANFDAVVSAMDIMQDDLAYKLSKHRVTLSTSGIVPALRKLGEVSDVSLAVSLHAPDNALRDELVPINRKHPIADLLDACWRYAEHYYGRFITFEYVMLDGINDSDTHARELIRILETVPAKVNLIPFNPFPETRYRRSPAARVDRFFELLNRAGIVTITRKTRGDDIDAACGQLAGDFMDRTTRRSKRAAATQVKH